MKLPYYCKKTHDPYHSTLNLLIWPSKSARAPVGLGGKLEEPLLLGAEVGAEVGAGVGVGVGAGAEATLETELVELELVELWLLLLLLVGLTFAEEVDVTGFDEFGIGFVEMDVGWVAIDDVDEEEDDDAAEDEEEIATGEGSTGSLSAFSISLKTLDAKLLRRTDITFWDRRLVVAFGALGLVAELELEVDFLSLGSSSSIAASGADN